jgi:ribonuclease D
VQLAGRKMPAIAEVVLGVHVLPNTAIKQSNWAARPLSPGQVHYAMQSAWLHAHLLDRLGGALTWHAPLLDACRVSTSD